MFLLILALPMVFASCKKEEVKDSTYSFSYTSSYTIPISIGIFEYTASNEKVEQNNFSFTGNFTKKFTANKRTEKLKVFITFGTGSSAESYWVDKVYYWDKGKNVNIDINDDTYLAEREP